MRKEKTLSFKVQNKNFSLKIDYSSFEDSNKIFQDHEVEYFIRQFRDEFILQRKIKNTECMNQILSVNPKIQLRDFVDKKLEFVS